MGWGKALEIGMVLQDGPRPEAGDDSWRDGSLPFLFIWPPPQKSNWTMRCMTKTPMASMQAAMPSHIWPVAVVNIGNR